MIETHRGRSRTCVLRWCRWNRLSPDSPVSYRCEPLSKAVLVRWIDPVLIATGCYGSMAFVAVTPKITTRAVDRGRSLNRRAAANHKYPNCGREASPWTARRMSRLMCTQIERGFGNR